EQIQPSECSQTICTCYRQRLSRWLRSRDRPNGFARPDFGICSRNRKYRERYDPADRPGRSTGLYRQTADYGNAAGWLCVGSSWQWKNGHSRRWRRLLSDGGQRLHSGRSAGRESTTDFVCECLQLEYFTIDYGAG